MNLSILKSKSVLFLSIAAGCLVGIRFPGAAARLAVFGEAYISLLKMCALPIVITTILISISQLFKTRRLEKYLTMISALFLGGMSVFGFLGALIGGRLIPRPDAAGGSNRVLDGVSRLMASHSAAAAVHPSMRTFILQIIPENIFQAISEGRILSILFFFIVFGVAIGKETHESVHALTDFFEAANRALFRIIDWLSYLIPLGMFYIFSISFSHQGVEMLFLLSRLFLVSSAGVVLVLAVSVYLIARYRPGRLPILLQSLQDCLLVGFSTTSSITAMPLGIKALENEFQLSKTSVEAVFPVALSFNFAASTFFYAAVAAFAASIYGIHLGAFGTCALVFGVILRGWATTGLPSLASIGAFVTIMAPLGIPGDTLVTITMALIPLMGPLLALANILFNCALLLPLDPLFSDAPL